MKAMILAAGLGTRLRPLTDNRPKALVEIDGRTLLEITLSRLRTFGIRDVIINVHHFADMILEYLKTNADFGMRIEVSREETLLDTGGGLKKAAHFFTADSSSSEDPFILHNVDVISTIDLSTHGSISHRTSRPRHTGCAKPGDFTIPAFRRATPALRSTIGTGSEKRVSSIPTTGAGAGFFRNPRYFPQISWNDDGRRHFLHHHLLSPSRCPRRTDPCL